MPSKLTHEYDPERKIARIELFNPAGENIGSKVVHNVKELQEVLDITKQLVELPEHREWGIIESLKKAGLPEE